MVDTITDPAKAAEQSYQEWRDNLWSNPEYRRIYDDEAEKTNLWLALVEARIDAGLTEEQMAERMGVSKRQVLKMERHEFETATLDMLRRYVKALGEGYKLEIRLHVPEKEAED